MLPRSSRRLLPVLARQQPASTTFLARSYSVLPTEKTPVSPVSSTNALPTSSAGSHDRALQENPEDGEALRVQQSPNRATTWSRNQQPRDKAMVGPRFEQTIIKDQPQPYAAINLIHKQPVRWTDKKVVSCDGGGGPLGHPRIFINTDKPKICWCTYCGVPYANTHHRKHLESLPINTYPLYPTGDAAELPQGDVSGSTGSTEPLQSNTGNKLEQR
ncbi:NADH-ubiquinone oxidoreductase [Acrodontium crateriforme]|uniref:NADH-ubiquinone oxidoreductase n=1 Tax=Acrodontium crateriforme TaxID=150365 RepID=A0AAQ3MAR5_9PEZI|nr:NADH-ubiquinone oxidoreductase [Acrodontium crateriforme]